MIYLDANASSRLRNSVVEFLRSCPQYYNPSSVHAEGRKAKAALRTARENILDLVNAKNADLIFTSGGTEACNLMLSGFLGAINKHTKIVSTAIEHPAVKQTLKSFKEAQIIEIAPELSGIINIEDLIKVIDNNTTLVNMMTVNNETGSIQDIAKLTTILRNNSYQGLIVSDASQALGKVKFDLTKLFELGLDAIAISGHKIGAPAGIGALIYNRSSTLCRFFYPQIFGGPQEKGYRAGTENLIGAISFGLAAKELNQNIDHEINLKKELTEYFFSLLNSRITSIRRYGESLSTAGNTLLLGFKNCLAGDLVAALDMNGIAISTGAACASGKQSVSDTVNALEKDSDRAKEVVRISIDWCTTRKELEHAVEVIETCVNRMRDV